MMDHIRIYRDQAVIPRELISQLPEMTAQVMHEREHEIRDALRELRAQLREEEHHKKWRRYYSMEDSHRR
jgi:hypothetical protein